MRFAWQGFLAIVLFAALAGARVAGAGQGDTAEISAAEVDTAEVDTAEVDTAAIDRFVAAYQQQRRVPGVAVVVTGGSEVLFARGYGHDSAGRAISETSRFPIASLSKSFTALAVMKLAEGGRIKLDDPVQGYLPDFVLADSRGDRITIRQLLEHTSGMSDLTFPEKSGPVPDSLQDAVALLRTATLATEPGSRRNYHNPNYWIAARLVEVVSGQSFDRYLEEEILAPLGMHDTFTIDCLAPDSEVASGYVRLFGYPISLPEPLWFLGGCAGVVTTAADMGRWLTFNNTGLTQAGERLISAAGLDALHQGLGWNAVLQGGRETFTHNGFLFTFNARQYVVPGVAGGLGIAVMANTGVGVAPLDSDVIAQGVLAIVEQKAPGSAGPSGLVVDVVLGILCLIALLWGACSLRRVPKWAVARQSRARWWIVVSQLPYLIPVLILVFYPQVLGRAAGGRNVSWVQSLYISIVLFALVAVVAAASVAVVAARAVALRRIAGNQPAQ